MEKKEKEPIMKMSMKKLSALLTKMLAEQQMPEFAKDPNVFLNTLGSKLMSAIVEFWEYGSNEIFLILIPKYIEQLKKYRDALYEEREEQIKIIEELAKLSDISPMVFIELISFFLLIQDNRDRMGVVNIRDFNDRKEPGEYLTDRFICMFRIAEEYIKVYDGNQDNMTTFLDIAWNEIREEFDDL